MKIDWAHKDVWAFRSHKFAVEVVRHSTPAGSHGEKENKWAVYAYVYPGHVKFDHFYKDERPFNQPRFDVHSYPSYYRAHLKADGTAISHQLGWDYAHDGDCFEEIDSKEGAWQVFSDAQGLIRQLEDSDED